MRRAVSAVTAAGRAMTTRAMIDLRKGHPVTAELPHAALARAASKAAEDLAKGDAAFSLQYGSSRGQAPCLETLRQWLEARYGSAVKRGGLMTTSGVSHGLDLCVRGGVSSAGVECRTSSAPVVPVFDVDSWLREKARLASTRVEEAPSSNIARRPARSPSRATRSSSSGRRTF